MKTLIRFVIHQCYNFTFIGLEILSLQLKTTPSSFITGTMVQPRSLLSALSVASLFLGISAIETDYDVDSSAAMLSRRSNKKTTSSRISQGRREDIRHFDPLSKEHAHRELQDVSAIKQACENSNKKMCGCEEVFQSDYRGPRSTTKNGFKCREWTMAENYPNQGLDDGAFCRNPNQVAARAWCFVENADVLWDYCDVPHCEAPASAPVQNSPTATVASGCINTARYDQIDADIEDISNSFNNDVDRSHFLGGIVRMVAHDFMDFDVNDKREPMGPDGCLDWTSSSNAGLSSIWCNNCPLTKLYNKKYSDISRADFWVIAGNAVIRLTSINKALDLRNTFYWGRKTSNSCVNSAFRLPTTNSCQDVEDVFLARLGLRWKDAVALLGAHTLGRGNSEVRVFG